MRHLLLALLLPWLIAPLAAAAQETPPAVSTQQRGGVYVAPPAEVDPIYVPAGPDAAPPRPAPPAALQLQLTLDMPLRGSSRAGLGRGVQGSTAAPPTLQAQLRWRPVRESWWFAQLTLFRYLRPDRQQPWHPDFSYAFGYDDWHPGSWSLLYANYTGTRLHPDAGEHRFNFPEGQWTLAYRFALPERLQPVLLVGDGDQANCDAAFHLMPRYVDNTDGRLHRHKKSLSAGCRYSRASGWYAEAAVFAYPQGVQQQPWDPDFTYGFGYAKGGPGTLSLRYNNYSGNRFPGRARGPGEGSFRSGGISLGWSREW